MDLIGCASYVLPGLGEELDLIWAPISAIMFYIAFGKHKAIYGALFNFAEEIIPFTDIIPTFTIVWLWQKYLAQKELPLNAKH